MVSIELVYKFQLSYRFPVLKSNYWFYYYQIETIKNSVEQVKSFQILFKQVHI